ncbi:hypothetical protein BY458DRAFT_500515 [Sporodiniella umbellata]|nr:hypothetical protein BY458DRAFT_500515 [Sporodiniella umbellata]
MSLTPTVEEFEGKGWYLSLEGIQSIAAENEQASSLDEYIRYAKDMDLSLLTSQGFNKTNEKLKEIPSPVVLQIVQVRNIATPSIHAGESPRLLQATLTDGHKKWKAIEIRQQLDCLKLHTPPGTKFLVTKPIPVQDQILLLEPGMLKELGGHVQELVQAWRAGKQFLKRNRNGKDKENQDSGPPAFVPFKIKPKGEEPNGKPRGKKPSLEEETNKKEMRDSKPSRPKKGPAPKEEEKTGEKQAREEPKPEDKKKKNKKNKKKATPQAKGEEEAEAPAVKTETLGEKQPTAREPRTRSERSKKDATKENEDRTLSESRPEDDKKTAPLEETRTERNKRNRNKNKKATEDPPVGAESNHDEQVVRKSERIAKKKQEAKEADQEPTKNAGKKERKKRNEKANEPNSTGEDEPVKRERLSRKAKKPVAEEVQHPPTDPETTQVTSPLAETTEKGSRQRKPKKNLSEDHDEAAQVMRAKRKPRKERGTEEGFRVVNEDPINTRGNRKKQWEKRKESQGSLDTRGVPEPERPLAGKESQSEQTRVAERPRKQKASHSHTGRKERKGGPFKPEKTSTAREEKVRSEEGSFTQAETSLNTEPSLASPHPPASSDPTYGSKGYEYSQQNPYSYSNPPVYAVPQQTSNGQTGYYYSSQPYSMADYSMMVPVYPSTGVHQGVYGYPSADPQQQQYMQPVYYQQPYYSNSSYQPYYNHQSYYNTDTTNQHHSQKQ